MVFWVNLIYRALHRHRPQWLAARPQKKLNLEYVNKFDVQRLIFGQLTDYW